MTAAEQKAYNNGFILGMAMGGVSSNWIKKLEPAEIYADKILFAWNNASKKYTQLDPIIRGSGWVYDGNFKGAWQIPLTAETDKLIKGAGTTKYDVTPYIKNDGTYIRFFIRGSGMTTSLITGDIKLYFEDGWSGTIAESVATGRIDPIAFRYTSRPQSQYVWNTANLFTGGRTDSKNYPDVYIYLKPLLPNTLTHFEFYTNIALNATYDGFTVSQTDITQIMEINI